MESKIVAIALGKGKGSTEEVQKMIEQLEKGEVRLSKLNVDISQLSSKDILALRCADVISAIIESKATIVNVSLYAEAYYSGAEYNEDVNITAEDFAEKIYGKVAVTDISMYDDNGVKDTSTISTVIICDLDGKHSEVTGHISVEYYTDEDLSNKELPSSYDGNNLSEYLFDYDSDVEKKCSDNFNNYLKNIDYQTTVTVKVKKSKLNELYEFVDKLNKQ